MDISSKFTGMEKKAGYYQISTDGAVIRICFLTEEIVRIRAAFDGKAGAEENSYVLSVTGWMDRMDDFFQGERTRLAPVMPLVSETEAAVLFKTPQLTLTVEKDPLNLVLEDEAGDILYSTVPGIGFVKDSNGRVVNYSRMNEDDCFYGFGEKDGLLDKNKEFIRERGTDSWAYDPEKCDTMYKHIPFYIRMDRKTRKAVGLFYHNFYESVFNMGREKSNYWPRYSYWQADGGDIDLFLLAGRSIRRTVDLYTVLTGRPALLPKRALGYQGSSMYYSELPEKCDEALLHFVDMVHQKGFPIDGFHLSSGFTVQKDNKRCVFTWNRTRFEDPAAFFEAMNARGAQCVPNVKPGVLLCHPAFGRFAEAGVFVRDSKNPDTPAVGAWWGGPGAFFDFTDPAARALWKKYLTDNIIRMGTDSVWDDNCEYDSLIDHDAVCKKDGLGGTIGELKPVMATIMSKLAFDSVKENNKDARPYVVCRSGCSGIQKYAQNWVGDNFTSWRTLRHNIPTILGMGLSGQPNEGADIGGFAGPAPEEELFVRWVQNGIFQSRFSIHSASSDNTVTEPWMYRNQTELIRSAILLRYRFAPYLYSLEYEAHRTGAPFMRALVYEFQEDPAVYDESFEFMFGRSILVANVLDKGVTEQAVYLPAGCRWYDWENHFAEYEGGQTITVPVSLASIPRFIREGAIIPMADNQLMNMQKDHTEELHLILAPGVDSSFTMYDDDGVSNDFENGVYRRTEITMTGKHVVEIAFRAEGSYQDYVKTVKLEVIRKDRSPFWITVGGKQIRHILDREDFAAAQEGWYYSETNRAVEVKYDNPHKDTVVKISFEDFNLLGM